MKHLRISQKRQQEIYGNIDDISTPRASFYIMVILSTTIAAYGLLSNSTAVVIGAMLVAPLMGPIFGIALGLSTGDGKLLRKALAAELFGLILATLVGMLIGLLPLRLDFGSEIMARTQPTLYDIIIALASGLAGAYALVDEKISPALPGVAIATALVPPLATCGLCLAAGRYEWSFGAFLLFLANLLAIELAAAIVFTFFGMSEAKPHEPYNILRFLKRFAISFIALAIAAIFMTGTLAGLIEERKLSRKIESVLSAEIHSSLGAQLSQTTIRKRGAAMEVIATVLTPQEFKPSQVARFESRLRKVVNPSVNLIVRSLISKDADRSGIVFIDEKERERLARTSEQTLLLTQTSQILEESLKKVSGAQLDEVRVDAENGDLTVIAAVDTPAVIAPSQVKEMEQSLGESLKKPVHLMVRSLMTRNADSQRFLYEEKKEVKPLTGDALAFYKRLQLEITKEIGRQVKGSMLIEVRYREKDKRLVVLASVKTPVNFRPLDVKIIEKGLRKSITPRLDLVIRSTVGTDTSSSGYVYLFDESRLSPDLNNEDARSVPGGGVPAVPGSGAGKEQP
ncbi:MAG: TIGR00341 family protein [Candidatus Eremiobacteraeota bacterium]|nr:TIGR00341 family protein [Candidatus Eremiobacteraeota bacterium]